MTQRRLERAISVPVASLFVCFCTAGCLSYESAPQPQPPRPGRHTFALEAGGVERSYVVHVPASYDPATPSPVVIMFHGGGGTARGAMWQTGWTDKAEEEGFLAVFPEGTRADPTWPARFLYNPQTWNDGSGRINLGAARRQVAEVEFVRAMIEDLCVRFAVDRRRIFATGFSNGASMAFRVGRELPKCLAAIAPVAGNDWSQQSTIERPVPVLYITGTSDPLNPIEGGEIWVGSLSFGEKPPLRDLIQKWVRLLGCPPDPRVLYDKDGVKGIAYGPGKDRSEVVLYTIEGMGHTWPGGTCLLPRRMVGETSDKIEATDVIWEFFQRHPLK